MRAAAVLLLCACLAAFTACGGGGSDEPDVAARSLVLTAEEVPPLYETNDAQTGPVSNEEVAASRPAGYEEKLEEWGRLDGYASQFVDDVAASPTGAGQRTIDSLASIYDDAEGAAESFAAGLEGYADAGFRPAGSVQLADEARAFRGGASLNGKPVEYLVVTWRRGPVISSVVTSAPPRKVSLTTVERLARAQDRRIAEKLADAA